MKPTKFARWATLSAALSLSVVAAADGNNAKDKSADVATGKTNKTTAKPKTETSTDAKPVAKPSDDKSAATVISSQMGKLSDTELSVLSHVHHSDEMEVKTGKLALQKSTDRGVKAFAQLLIDDHGSDARNIEQLVAKQNQALPAPKPLDEADKVDQQLAEQTLAKLNSMQAKQFDVEFLRAQVAMHDKTLAKLDKDIAMIKDNADLTAMLRGNRPVIVKHADMARTLLGEDAEQARRAK